MKTNTLSATCYDNALEAFWDSPRTRKPRLGELLCEHGLITPEQLEEALERQRTQSPRQQLGRILVDLGFVEAEAMLRVLAESVGRPFVRLTPDMVQPAALGALPDDFVDQNNLLPLSLVEDQLTIAVEQFTNVFLLEEIGRRSCCEVHVIAAEGENIRQTRSAARAAHNRPRSRSNPGAPGLDGLDHILGRIDDGESRRAGMEADENEPDEDDAFAAATDSPTVKLVNYIIQQAGESRASDIHIEPDGNTFRVRYRVDGDLFDAMRPSSRLLPAVVSRIKILARMDISERRLPQDGSVTMTFGERPIDLRVSTMTTRIGEKVVIRLVDREASVRTLDSLGFAPGMLEQFRVVVREANGIVLVTGPTGSGKTTTLYAALAELVSDKDNISTIEDPVERRLAGTNQFQVHPLAGFTFAKALRSLLRQDPDIIMVGEIRDAETAKLATEAALTGHLVLSTLHTNDAPTAVPRLVNMGVEPYLVAASLRGVLAQRLVRRICTHCRKSVTLCETDRDTLTQMCVPLLNRLSSEREQNNRTGAADLVAGCPIDTVYSGAGCGHCRESGYSGRIGVFELLLLNEALLSTVVRDPSVRDLRALARRQGWTTLIEDGLTKVREGRIGVDGLLEIASRTDDFINVPDQA